MEVTILVCVKLYVEQCPKAHEYIDYMTQVSYVSAIGSLMYAMVYTWPNIAHSLGVLSSYMSILGNEHWIYVKRVFKYLCGTTNYTIFYQGKHEIDRKVNAHDFVDSN